jgi:hypothetical protein
VAKIADERKVPEVGVELLPFYKFAEKWFAALATTGIQELRQASGDPWQCGLSGMCETAYASYLRTCYEWDPVKAERIRTRALGARKVAPAPVAADPVVAK